MRETMTPRRMAAFGAVTAVGAALLTLYVVEAALTFTSATWSDRLGNTLRRGPSVIGETHRLRESGVRAYPYLQTDLFPDANPAPLSGITSELTVLCNESGTTIGYRSDSLGFRNSNSRWTSPAVALIGDSFTHGFCRTQSEAIDARLSGRSIEAVNAGATGAGPLAELGILREFLAPIRPRVVYWLFYEGNDLIDLMSERNTILRRYLEPDFTQNLVSKRASVDNRMKRFADSAIAAWKPPSSRDRLYAFAILRRLRTETGMFAAPQQPEKRDEGAELQLFAEILSAAMKEAEAWRGEVRLVYLPERRRFNKSTRAVTGENHDPMEVQRAVLAIADGIGMPVIDVAAEFSKVSDPRSLWSNRRYHYNAEGYRIVADAIADDFARIRSSRDTSKTVTVAPREVR